MTQFNDGFSVGFQINGIRKFSLDSQILSLNHLQILNMSDNCIEQLPKRLGDLPLVQLDLSMNRLCKTRSKDWEWIDRPTIRSTLQNLNLSSNKVSRTTLSGFNRPYFSAVMPLIR